MKETVNNKRFIFSFIFVFPMNTIHTYIFTIVKRKYIEDNWCKVQIFRNLLVIVTDKET